MPTQEEVKASLKELLGYYGTGGMEIAYALSLLTSIDDFILEIPTYGKKRGAEYSFSSRVIVKMSQEHKEEYLSGLLSEVERRIGIITENRAVMPSFAPDKLTHREIEELRANVMRDSYNKTILTYEAPVEAIKGYLRPSFADGKIGVIVSGE